MKGFWTDIDVQEDTAPSGCSGRDRDSTNEGPLALPRSEAVRQQMLRGGSSVTFLQIALGIVSRLEREVDVNLFGDELRFLRECLHAGPAKTQMPCGLVDRGVDGTDFRRSLCETYTSERHVALIKRQGYEYRGALRAVRGLSNAVKGGATETQEVVEPSSPSTCTGLPWMGPPVPVWPLADLSPSTPSKLQQLLSEQFNLWDFDVFQLARLSNDRPLLFAGWEALNRSSAFCEFQIDWKKVTKFLQVAEEGYATERQTAYHNNIHAADVTQTVHAFCHDLGIGAYYDPMDCFVSVLSAIIHDMGHDGRTNAFHINVQDELAITYNDRSVLENHHLATAFKLLIGDAPTNMLAGMSKEQLAIVRREVIDMVLGTDMSQHFTRVGDFTESVKRLGCDPVNWQTEEPAMYVLRSLVLHSADISNPTKPFKLSRQWSIRVLREFFAQGDYEKSIGTAISPLCDRDRTDVPGSQMGFISFIVTPAYEAIAELLPRVHEVCMTQVQLNLKAWEHRSRHSNFFEDSLDAAEEGRGDEADVLSQEEADPAAKHKPASLGLALALGPAKPPVCKDMDCMLEESFLTHTAEEIRGTELMHVEEKSCSPLGLWLTLFSRNACAGCSPAA